MNEKPRTIEIEGYLLQVKKIGNSVGLILPKELLARLKLKEGDKLHVIEQPERGMKLSDACRKQLEDAETRVETLIRKEGTYQPEPFRPEK